MLSHAIGTMPGSVSVLAALWVTLGRCLGQSLFPGCDNGKVLLETDLPKDAAHWDCPASLWLQSQRLYSVDTVYDPEPATLTCMNQRITYNHAIPNSGAYRPVSVESGEYLYCPPQRWINNLHHGATVLLYHPCSPPHERQLLSALARSCISDYILTPHKNLDRNRPIALVSWGRTLEISTVASSEICDWLNATTSKQPKPAELRYKSQYNLLLTRSENQDRNKGKKKVPTSLSLSKSSCQRLTSGSVKRCCEETISSLLEDLKETQLRLRFRREIIRQHNKRRKRAALNSTADLPKVSSDQTNSSSIIHRLQSNALPKTISSQIVNERSTKHALSRSTSLKENPIPKKFSPNTSRTTINNVPLARLHATDSNKMEKVQQKDNEVIDLEAREVVNVNDDVKYQQTELNGLDSATKSQAVGHKSSDCQCKPNHVCECSKGLDKSQIFMRTPRTDEAVWAAGALGFLLGLLTLCILHTRLYKHWKRGTSLYWHDPQQDYDSVADVIRRRLRLAKRRRKRGRKKEVVLLPSSSSSEEYP
ncbi:hypothetical protein WMY93_028693 [Mugilogobius chulae]|uniref:Tumor protein p53-inducible protein 13 n=1 Tax=Mugilogobius chulae TaxID=88201 RepID=A0AAW0N016_9GOBI